MYVYIYMYIYIYLMLLRASCTTNSNVSASPNTKHIVQSGHGWQHGGDGQERAVQANA